MKRAWVVVVVIALVGCKKKDEQGNPRKAGSAAVAQVDKAPVKIEGPSITPVVTSSITFFAPKDAPWWGEMAFGCYAGAIMLQPGNSPSATFTKISPMVEPALRTADIDLDKDLGAIGAWGCGNGACIYLALELRKPERLREMLAQIVPGQTPKDLGKLHWSIEAPGAQGPRVITVRALPINWPAKLPADAWSKLSGRATHVVFLTGLFDATTQVDALAAMADEKTAAAKVIDAESLVSDPRGRCIVGHVQKRAFQPGYELERARFILAAPEGAGDALTRMLGSTRTLDLEVELVLNPAPNDKKVAAWIAEARAYIRGIGDSVRGGFADQGALVDAMYEMAGLLGKSGFRHTLEDKALRLSFRTDRISTGELAAVEAKLEGAMKQMGITQ
ncbi:MAG TPA: hypothetical protein VIV11_13125 [Kofleriaceae bacterium]